MIRLLPYLILLCLIIAAIVTVAATSRAPRPGDDAQLAAQVEDLARSHRDLDEGTLPSAVIARIVAAKRSQVPDPWAEVADDVLELAYTHRNESPELSVLLTDLIMESRRKRLE